MKKIFAITIFVVTGLGLIYGSLVMFNFEWEWILIVWGIIIGAIILAIILSWALYILIN